MDDIRQWAFSACAALVSCAIAGIILPKGSLQKVFSITVSVFFLCCLLSPVVLRVPALAIDIQGHSMEDIERRAELVKEITAFQSGEAASLGVKKIIAGKLDEMGIKYTAITINISTNIPAEGSAYAGGADQNAAGQDTMKINSVDITLAKEHEESHEMIRRELEYSLGFKVRLGYQ